MLCIQLQIKSTLWAIKISVVSLFPALFGGIYSGNCKSYSKTSMLYHMAYGYRQACYLKQVCNLGSYWYAELCSFGIISIWWGGSVWRISIHQDWCDQIFWEGHFGSAEFYNACSQVSYWEAAVKGHNGWRQNYKVAASSNIKNFPRWESLQTMAFLWFIFVHKLLTLGEKIWGSLSSWFSLSNYYLSCLCFSWLWFGGLHPQFKKFVFVLKVICKWAFEGIKERRTVYQVFESQ